MPELDQFGRLLIVIGVVAVGVGLLLTLAGRLPGIGRLPGDFLLRRGNLTLYFPLATSIVLSIILTVLFRIFRH
ncbi:MAG: DUF2905 domain-containing protein [Chloroflexota bacterium]